MAAGTLQCPMCGAPASTDATHCDHCGARLATVSCPSCFGLMFAGQKFCPHCGARADRKEAEVSKLLCPRCRLRMAEVQLGQTLLFECSKCEGIWADKVSLEQICADRERQAAVLGMPSQIQTDLTGTMEATVRYIPCPVCKKLMNRVNFAKCSHVVVDVCSQHGTWFDKDELRRIVEFIRGGGLEQARAKELAAIEEQRRSLKAAQMGSAWDDRLQDPQSGPSLLNLFLG